MGDTSKKNSPQPSSTEATDAFFNLLKQAAGDAGEREGSRLGREKGERAFGGLGKFFGGGEIGKKAGAKTGREEATQGFEEETREARALIGQAEGAIMDMAQQLGLSNVAEPLQDIAADVAPPVASMVAPLLDEVVQQKAEEKAHPGARQEGHGLGGALLNGFSQLIKLPFQR